MHAKEENVLGMEAGEEMTISSLKRIVTSSITITESRTIKSMNINVGLYGYVGMKYPAFILRVMLGYQCVLNISGGNMMKIVKAELQVGCECRAWRYI